MPVREKSEEAPARSLHVPSQVPRHPQNAAKVRGFSPTAPGLAAETDCLLEQEGFELAIQIPFSVNASMMWAAKASGSPNAFSLIVFAMMRLMDRAPSDMAVLPQQWCHRAKR
jgi:hypothetical protein